MLILIECSDFPFRSTALKICTIFQWQMLREICEVAALTDFKVSSRLMHLVRGFYQVGTTLSLENTFNDLRDVERRSRKSLDVSENEMHTTQVRALKNRYKLPQVELTDVDFSDTGFAVNHHVDKALFHSSSLSDQRIGVDVSLLKGDKTWPTINPERFSNIMLALIFALILLGDLSKAHLLWMSGLFCKGMVIQSGADYYMILFCSPYIFSVLALILVNELLRFDMSPTASMRNFICTSMDDYIIHTYTMSFSKVFFHTTHTPMIFFTPTGTVTLLYFILNHTICNLSNDCLEGLVSTLKITGVPAKTTLAAKVAAIMNARGCSSELVVLMLSLVEVRSKKKKKTEDDESDESEDDVDPFVVAAMARDEAPGAKSRPRAGFPEGEQQKDDGAPTEHHAGERVFSTPATSEQLPEGCLLGLDLGGKKAGTVVPHWVLRLPPGGWHENKMSHSLPFNSGTPVDSHISDSSEMCRLRTIRWGWEWNDAGRFMAAPSSSAASGSGGPSGGTASKQRRTK